MAFTFAEFQMSCFSVEVGGLHLGAGQVAFEQVVFGQQIRILQAQALLHTTTVGVGLHTHWCDAQCIQGIPQGQAVFILEVQFPALLAHIRNVESQHRHALDFQLTQSRKGEVLVRPCLGLVGNFLDGGAGVGAPKPQATILRGGIGYRHIGTAVLCHATYPGQVAVPGIGTVDHAVVVLAQTQHRQIGAHTTLAVQEVGVDAFAHRGVTAHLGHADVFQQVRSIRAHHIDLGEVRDVDHAHVFRHLEMFGIRHAPEVAVVPLVGTHRHLVAVDRQQMLVAGITVCTLPARELHEIGA